MKEAGWKRIAYAFSIYFLMLSLVGCDAFVRKFTRKPDKEDLPEEELVLVPQEYKTTVSKEDQYRQYFLFWKSWQEELIQALLVKTNRKKPLNCADEALKNLTELKRMLNEKEQKKLEVYISQLKNLREAVADDTYGSDISSQRMSAERIKRSILRDFSYNKIKDSLS